MAGMTKTASAKSTKAATEVDAYVGLVDGKAKVYAGKVEKYDATFFVAGGDDASTEVRATIALPEGTHLDRALFTITAAPGDRTSVTSVAVVRTAAVPGSTGTSQAKENGCTIDFGRLVSVSDFALAGVDRLAKTGGVSIARIFPWTGAGWAPTALDPDAFTEVQTERLLVTSTASESALLKAVEDDGVVLLPTQPTGLELQIDGSTVWFERQGSVAGLTGTQAPGSYTVDRTEAVRDALARARPSGGKRAVTATLRATTPGQLGLTVRAEILHEYRAPLAPHTFTSTLPLSEENLLTLELSDHDATSPFSPTDSIRKVSLAVRGTFGPERVEPVEEPTSVPQTSLVLGGGRTVLLGIPAALVTPFGALQAVRVKVSSEKGGEVAGRLLHGDHDGRPGEAVPGGDVPPVGVPASTDPGWLTLPFPNEVAVVEPRSPATLPQLPYWLELTATYGEVSCSLTRDTTVPAARLLRRLPGGGTRPMSVLGRKLPAVGDEPPLRVPLRVVGLPGKKQPLPAVTFRVGGPTNSVVSGTTPTTDGLGLDIGLGNGVPPVAGTSSPTRLVLPVHLRVGAPGTLTLADVVVLYQKGDKTT